MMSLATRLLERPWVYRLWQAPFAEQKVRHLLSHTDLASAQRVLDLACGPGTNARHFSHCAYVGLDINPEYVAYARGRYSGDFGVADVTRSLPVEGCFDFVLVNSFLHHVPDEVAAAVLGRLTDAMTPESRIHVMDLVQPANPGLPRFLANRDRGEYPRNPSHWHSLFTAAFEEEAFEPFAIGFPGVPLWQMVYFRGRLRP